MNERAPIGGVLAGLEIHPLPPGWTPLDAFVLVKSMDAEGRVRWSQRTTSTMRHDELVGTLTIQYALVLDEAKAEWAVDVED